MGDGKRNALTAPTHRRGMVRYLLMACWLIAHICPPPLGVQAEIAGSWETGRKSDYLSGNLFGISVSDNGILRPSPSVKTIATCAESVILSSAVAKNGDLYVGTGHNGRVLALKTGKSEFHPVADFDEMDVTALACGAEGAVYAASSPDGRIYRIDANGKKDELTRLKEKYIWSLLALPDGSVMAGTGSKGAVYRINQRGEVRKALETDQSNVTALLLRRDGEIWAGTDPGGIIFRIDLRSGRTTDVFDSPCREIKRLVQSPNGDVFALGVGAERPPSDPPAQEGAASDAIIIAAESAPAVNPAPAPGRERPDSTGTTVYRFTERDDTPETVWSSPDVVGASLSPSSDGATVLVGSARQGRIFKIHPDGRSDLFAHIREEQVAFLTRIGSAVQVVSNGPAAAAVLDETPRSDGVFTSTVRDAKFPVAAWGSVSWKGKGEIQVETRTGNTLVPNGSFWSDWSSPIARSGGKVTSPPGRFMQWRVTLRPGAELSYFRLTYLPRNVAPSIISLSVTPPGVALQDALQPPPDPAIAGAGLDPAQFGFSPPQPPRKVFQRGARSVQWQAEDRNGDPLSYRVFVRERGADAWRQVAANLRVPYFVVSPDTLPDGLYEFQVEASDAPGNPDGYALTAVAVTEPTAFDNTPPSVAFQSAPKRNPDGTWMIAFSVSDAGTLKSVEYSLDYGPWRPVHPRDKVLDGGEEEFLVHLGSLGAGEHIVSVRAMDATLNMASEKSRFKSAP